MNEKKLLEILYEARDHAVAGRSWNAQYCIQQCIGIVDKQLFAKTSRGLTQRAADVKPRRASKVKSRLTQHPHETT
jgi:hypothetical protein